jgi:uncharacterized protein YkwD
MLLRNLWAVTMLLASCGPQQGATDDSSVRDLSDQSYQADFRIALSDQASLNGAYKVAVSAASGLKESSLRICPATRERCLRDEVASVPATLVKRDERLFYLADEAMQLTDSMVLTVIAETVGGEQVVDSYQLKSVTSESSPCHKAPDEFVCDVEGHIARLTNEFRQNQGRGALVHDQKMSYVSRLWSAEQARTGQISHAWFSNGRWRQEYVREFGEQPRLTAENVAMNSGSGDAEQVARRFVNQWINSAGHRANMLSGHKTIGVGIARRGNAWYGTQNFGN